MWEKEGGDCGGPLTPSEGLARLGAWRLTGWGWEAEGPWRRLPDFCLGIQEGGTPIPETRHPEGGTGLGHCDKSFRMWLRDVRAIQSTGYKRDVKRLRS